MSMAVSIALDFIISLGTATVFFIFSGKNSIPKPMQYFTVQSNIFVSAVSLICAVWGLSGAEPGWLVILKYSATCSVTVTFLTVFLYLGPRFRNWDFLLSGANLWMHLFCPVFAIASLLLRAPLSLPFAASFAGLAPVVLYSLLYLKMVVFESDERKWDDLYGFTDGIRWVWSMAAMYLASYAVSLLLRALLAAF